METSVRITIIHLTREDAMEVSYFIADTHNTPVSRMYNLFVRSATNLIPSLEQAVSEAVLNDESLQLRMVNELVRSYLIAVNRVPNTDISFQLDGETVTGNLAGSDVWWTFTSTSPAFLKYFPGAMLRINTIFAEPPALQIQGMIDLFQERSASLTWNAADN